MFNLNQLTKGISSFNIVKTMFMFSINKMNEQMNEFKLINSHVTLKIITFFFRL